MLDFTKLILVFCLSAFSSGSAAAGSDEENIIGAFEVFCLESINEPVQIPKIAASIGMTEVPDNQRDAFLAGHPGRAWLNSNQSGRFVVALTDQGACAVMAPYVSGDVTLNLLLKNSRNRRLNMEQIGSETHSVYAITRPDRRGRSDIHAIVSVAISNLKSMDGIQINAISETLARNNGITIPPWP